MTATEVIELARAKSVVDDNTLTIIQSDPGVVAWLDEWLPNRAAGTLAMVQGVVPEEITARLSPDHAQRLKSALPALMWLYTTRGANAQS